MKFLHMADIHLGARPDSGQPWSEQRAGEIWDTFRRALQLAREEQVDLVLIAGDLFHRPPERQQLREVDYLLASIAPIRVVLVAGNHDHLDPDGEMTRFGWSRNVTCLSGKEFQTVEFPELGARVCGRSYYAQEDRRPLLEGARPGDASMTRILLAHGGDAKHMPFAAGELAGSHFDYIALGHIHRPGEVVPGKARYAGAPEPIDCADTGRHGVILGEAHGHLVRTEFVELACRNYRRAQLRCSEEDTTYSLLDRLRGHIEEAGPRDIWQIRLVGERKPGQSCDTAVLQRAGCVLEVVDETRPALNLPRLRQQYRGQLIGRYIESFADAPEDERQMRALWYGLEALLAEAEEA